MMDNSIEKSVGNWNFVRYLGTGGFGKVMLWKNAETGESVALKTLKFSMDEGNETYVARWAQEIKIMQSLDHDNVVRAVTLDEDLSKIKVDMPILGMEFCAEGDLRKVLQKPRNASGLSEYEVRCISHDIASAIEYLHLNSVLHRDIKPENIILQKSDQKVVYKLIDLGYAKEIHQGSICHSLVGTYEYLAPELVTKSYTRTVDYWSFGIVVFEVITGFRPFLSANVSPYEWHQKVRKKTPEQIYVYQDMKGETVYSESLPEPNRLSRTMKKYMEIFLRLMLLWEPKVRGGKPDAETGRPACFKLLDDVLGSKIVHVLNMEANQLLTYPMKDKHFINDLQPHLEKEAKIPGTEQEFMNMIGHPPDPSKPCTQFWTEPSSDKWPIHIFLFRKRKEFSQTLSVPPYSQPPFLVKMLLDSPHVVHTGPKRMWGQVCSYCHQLTSNYSQLAQGQRAAMLSVLKINSSFSKKKVLLSTTVKCFLSNRQLYKTSHDLDISRYTAQKEMGIASENMWRRWMNMAGEIENFGTLEEKMKMIEQKGIALQTKIVELQKSPYAKSSSAGIEPLEELSRQAEEECEKLRDLLRQNDGTPNYSFVVTNGNKKMRHFVFEIQKLWTKQVKDLYLHLRKILDYKAELHELMPHVEKLLGDVNHCQIKLYESQKRRQEDIWKLLRIASTKVQRPTGEPIAISRSMLLSSSSSEGYAMAPPEMMDTSQYFEKKSEELFSTISENNDTRNRLDSMFSSYTEDQMKSISDVDQVWDFLMDSNNVFPTSPN